MALGAFVAFGSQIGLPALKAEISLCSYADASADADENADAYADA